VVRRSHVTKNWAQRSVFGRSVARADAGEAARRSGRLREDSLGRAQGCSRGANDHSREISPATADSRIFEDPGSTPGSCPREDRPDIARASIMAAILSTVLPGIRPDGHGLLGLNRQRRRKRPPICKSWMGAIDPLPSAKMLRTGRRNRLKPPFKSSQRVASTSSDWMPAQRTTIAPAHGCSTVGVGRHWTRSICRSAAACRARRRITAHLLDRR
jgi:hypothetical protein